jgi:hypothetical protein
MSLQGTQPLPKIYINYSLNYVMNWDKPVLSNHNEGIANMADRKLVMVDGFD